MTTIEEPTIGKPTLARARLSLWGFLVTTYPNNPEFTLEDYEGLAEVLAGFYDQAEKGRRDDLLEKVRLKQIPADAEINLQAYICCEGLADRYYADEMAKNLLAMPYQEFLKTEYWSVIRAVAVSRAHGKCQLCFKRGLLHTHHKTYEHRGREYAHMDDLICLCRECHQKFHDKLPKDYSSANI